MLTAHAPGVLITLESSGPVLMELGVVLLVLAYFGRLASRIGIPSIPLYLVAGLVLGNETIVPLDASEDFIRIGADLGVVLLLLLLGLEYGPTDLLSGLRTNWPAGILDAVANFVPGFGVALLLGWTPLTAFVLGGVTYISSSGIIAKLLGDLDRVANRETPVVLSILVIEDLAMAVFLPVLGVLLVGASPLEGGAAIVVALVVVALAFVISLRYSHLVNRLIATPSRELLLLGLLGMTFLVAGIAAELQISAAVGAFLLGLTLSGRVAEDGRELLPPVRDVFGGMFFVFFGLQIHLATLPPMIVPAIGLALVTAATKVGTGWWAAKRVGIGRKGRIRAGFALVPRGEFSIVIAGFGVAAGLEPQLGPLVATYVLVLAVAGSIGIRFAGQKPRGRPGSDVAPTTL